MVHCQNKLNLPGEDIFEGTIVHSVAYSTSIDVKVVLRIDFSHLRKTDPRILHLQDKNVVIIGNDRCAYRSKLEVTALTLANMYV